MRRLFGVLAVLALSACAAEEPVDGGPPGTPWADVAGDVSDTGPAPADLPDTTEPPPDEASLDLRQDAEPEDGGPDGAEAPDLPAPPDGEPDSFVPPPPCFPGAPCDDGDPCTYDDRCSPADEGASQCMGKPYSCDDGRPCTDDICKGDGDCVFAVQDGACLIANVCYVPGDSHADNDCVVCDPTSSGSEWSLAADGTPCGEADPCLSLGACVEGQCDAEPASCDDGNPCTDDLCDPAKGCTAAWNFEPCDDGDPCSVGDVCEEGVCSAGLIELVCNDGEACTADVCGSEGCVFVPAPGPCSDGTECTAGDHCEGGECVPGPPLECDDGNFCTADACDPYIGCIYDLVASACCVAGVSVCNDGHPCTTDLCNEAEATCYFEKNQAKCEDGDPCTGPDACVDGACAGPPMSCDDGNPCTADSCQSDLGGCQHEAISAACDDGNACTASDKCVGGTCTGAPLSCNDDNPCTTDGCVPKPAAQGGGCKNVLKEGTCNDGNACTTGDACKDVGGGNIACKGAPLGCDDGNQCTNDSCHPSLGCQHQSIGGACSDGLDCSTGDHCTGGVCVADMSGCGCVPVFSDVVTRVTKLLLGETGHPGAGLDIDGDKNTCAPPGECSGGIDNQLALFSSVANGPLAEEVEKGKIILLFEHHAFQPGGKTYTLNFFPGKPGPGGTYLVEESGLDPETCEAVVAFTNTKIVGGKTLSAGGLGYDFPLELPVSGITLSLTMNNAQIQAQVQVVGSKVVSMKGVLGGAIAKETFLAAIEAIPESELPPGMSKDTIKMLIQMLVENDIDTNKDGKPDAASVGVTFEGVASTISGVDY